MCGGIALNFSDVTEEELLLFFPPEAIAFLKRAGRVESFFWSLRPLLPVLFPGSRTGKPKLIDWGNREKEILLPRTGWARDESLQQGRWNHLRLQDVTIPARQGYEKKVWFDIADGIEGVLAEKDGIVRAYMITVPADEAYEKLTGHDRMPKIRR